MNCMVAGSPDQNAGDNADERFVVPFHVSFPPFSMWQTDSQLLKKPGCCLVKMGTSQGWSIDGSVTPGTMAARQICAWREPREFTKFVSQMGLIAIARR
jgi:hypothetical protein